MTTPSSAAPARPDASEYPSFYAGYIALVPEDEGILAVLRTAGDELVYALQGIAEGKGEHRYAEGKWSIRTLIGHMIDAERIFTYRALRVARGDATPLPGFEENDYAVSAESDRRTVADLAAEMAAVRESTLRLFESLPPDAWTRRGTVNNGIVSARALAYITAGHAQHHLRVLRVRYGI